MFLVSIEGIIGSGKSTIVDILSKDSNFFGITEPVDIYSKFQNFNPLKETYCNPKNNAVSTQFYIVNSGISYYSSEILKSITSKSSIVVSDRCVLSSLVFTDTNYVLNNFSLFTKEYLSFYVKDKVLCNKLLIPKLFIYLNISFDLALNRIKHRNRQSENLISVEFLKALNKNYYRFFRKYSNIPCVIIPINESDTPEIIASKIKNIILCFFSKK